MFRMQKKKGVQKEIPSKILSNLTTLKKNTETKLECKLQHHRSENGFIPFNKKIILNNLFLHKTLL